MTNRPLDEEAIFHIARDLSDSEKRVAYLNQVCSGDPSLLERIEGLLRAYEEEQGFLKSNNRVASTVDSFEIGKDAPQQIGPYKIREQIGEGGMGIVYVAEQQSPIRRKVALKVIKPGMDSKEVVARFEAERQALAMMDHPGIAKVFDGGATETGQPYFAMELINGIPITQYCDEQKLGIRERLELFSAVCHAVQHAHQKGVIHRDIKPTNVLVTLHDGKPVPVVIDFGVAKATNQNLTDQTIYTRLHQVVGTTLYMSPEQAELSRFGVDTRTDIYSLGVLLYEMLSGTTPFDRERFKQAALDEVRRIIREEEPPKPSTRLSSLGDNATRVSSLRRTDPQKLRHSLRGDLDWIVMMALDKDRNRRYETANGLAMDVTRYLDDEPILARPPSAWYRMQKFYSRNKALTTTLLLIILSLATGLTLAIWGLNEANTAKGEAIQAAKSEETERVKKEKLADKLSEQLYRESMRSARNLYYENNLSEVKKILKDNRDHPLVQSGEDFNWYSLWKECDDAKLSKKVGIDQALNRVDFHPSENMIVVSDWIGQVYLFEFLNDEFNPLWKESRNESDQYLVDRATRPTFVDDGRYVFFPVFVKTLDSEKNNVLSVEFRFIPTRDKSRAFNLKTTIQVEGNPEYINCCASPSGRIAFAQDDGTLSIWESDPDKRKVKLIDEIASRGPLRADHGGLEFCPVDPDLLVTIYDTNGIWLNHVGNRDRDIQIAADEDYPIAWDVTWSPDGKKLLSGHFDKNARIFDVESGQAEALLSGFHQNEIYCVAWSSNGRLLATGGRDGVVRVFDATTREVIDTLRFHSGLIYTLNFSTNQKGETWLFAGTRSNELWATPMRQLQSSVFRLNAIVERFGLSSDGRSLAAACESDKSNSESYERLRFFRTSDGKEIETKIGQEQYQSMAFSGGKFAAALSVSGQLQIIDLDSKSIVRESNLKLPSKPDLFCYSGNESMLAAIFREKNNAYRARFFSVSDLNQKGLDISLQGPVSQCAISCDNKKMAVGRKDGNTIEVFDIETGDLIWQNSLTSGNLSWYELQFSPTNSNVLAAGGWNGQLHVWKLGSPSRSTVINGHLGTLRSLVFSKKGNILYSCGSEGIVKAWRMPNCEPMFSIRLYEDSRIALHGATFSRDRSILAARHRRWGRFNLIRAATPRDVEKSVWWNNDINSDAEK